MYPNPVARPKETILIFPKTILWERY